MMAPPPLLRHQLGCFSGRDAGGRQLHGDVGLPETRVVQFGALTPTGGARISAAYPDVEPAQCLSGGLDRFCCKRRFTHIRGYEPSLRTLVLWKSTDKRGPTIGCSIQHDQLDARLNHTLRHRRAYEPEPTRHGDA